MRVKLYTTSQLSLSRTKGVHAQTHVGTDCQLLPNYIKKHNCEKFYFDWPERLHYGFQTTGAHLIDFDFIRFDPSDRPFSAINCICWGQSPSQRYRHKSPRTGIGRGRKTLSLAWQLYCLDVASSPSPRTSSARKTEFWNRPTCKDVGLDETWDLASTRIYNL